MQSKINEFLNVIQNATEIVNKGKGLVDNDYLYAFSNSGQQLAKNVEQVMAHDRSIHIGIVGRVKAGKSSFLNALLFDGEPLLPKAATPMTAGLTRIVYAEKPYAKVVYYDRKDWSDIQKQAAEYDSELDRRFVEEKKRAKRRVSEEVLRNRVAEKMPDNLKACKELVSMANNTPSIKGKLGNHEVIKIDDLKDYVGSHGQYSPIVKNVELGVDKPVLKDMVVVDTPGLGDPIISRSKEAKDFLSSCDLAILLSTASQFMGNEDMQLLSETLPGEGIENVAFVASKFDSGMLDDPNSEKQPIDEVFAVTEWKLKEVLEQQIDSRSQTVRQFDKIATKYRNGETKLHVISSLMFSAAQKKANGQKFNEEEQKAIDSMKERFIGMDDSEEYLRDLSGISVFYEEEFEPIREKKEKIVQEHQNNYIKDHCIDFIKQLNTIHDEAASNLNQLEESSIKNSQQKIKLIQEAAIRMRSQLEDVFEQANHDISIRLREISSEIRGVSSNYNDIDVSTKKEVEHHTKGHLFWKKNYDTVSQYSTASVSDVVRNIGQYVDESDRLIIQNMNNAFDINDIKQKVQRIVKDTFENSDIDFNVDDVVRPVKLMLEQLTLPPFKTVDSKKYQKEISDSFYSATVTDDEIATLKVKQLEVMEEIKSDIVDKLSEIESQVSQLMKEKAVNFTDDIEKHLVRSQKMLQSNLNNKQANIERYKEYLQQLKDAKSVFQNFEV